MSHWQLQHLSQAELFELLAQGLDPEATRVLQEMPPVLRESLFFPYTAGLNFTQGLYTAGGWGAIDAAFADPPASTEQILHPEKYAAEEEAVQVELPEDLAGKIGAGWSTALEDTLGEFQLKIWLGETAKAASVGATDAAAGWGGDRVAVLNGPNDAWVIALLTDWDTNADATEFATAATEALEECRRRRNDLGLRRSTPGRDRIEPGRGGRGERALQRARRLTAPQLHRVGRGNPQQAERVGERGLRGRGQGEPPGRSVGLRRIDDFCIAIEGVELGRKLRRVGRHARGSPRPRPRPRRPPAGGR